jgi:hypothetical protein
LDADPQISAGKFKMRVTTRAVSLNRLWKGEVQVQAFIEFPDFGHRTKPIGDEGPVNCLSMSRKRDGPSDKEAVLTIAIMSFLGVVIGASLQYIFTRYLETQRHLRELRSQAYLDYFKGISEQVHRTDLQELEDRDPLGRVADAKARICLYGSRDVIRSLASFENLGAALSSNEQRAAFVAMVAAMRADSGVVPPPESRDIEIVLLGKS